MREISTFQVGILVTCEDLYTDRQWKICHAFATFVARRTEAGKVNYRHKCSFPNTCSVSPEVFFFFCVTCSQVQLNQVVPHTQMEQMEYSLAAERRRMRLIHAEIITDLLNSSTAQLGMGLGCIIGL